jgi:hypothetical protein
MVALSASSFTDASITQMRETCTFELDRYDDRMVSADKLAAILGTWPAANAAAGCFFFGR